LTQIFLDHLLRHSHNIPNAHVTLTAMHPDGNRATPSRHTPLNDPHALHDNLNDLLLANALGWGAFVSIGLRRAGLSRWQRGGAADVVALPALFVDVDHPSEATRQALEQFDPTPSALIFTGGGYHAYWWMDPPMTDLKLADRLLKGLATWLSGDRLGVAGMLRLPTSQNTKPSRGNRVDIITLSGRAYRARDFRAVLPVIPMPKAKNTPAGKPLDARVITDHLKGLGYRQRGEWLVGRCPSAERHQHGDQNPSFGVNVQSGFGHCFVCGTFHPTQLQDLFAIR
jgi:hypothetical protein